MLIYDLSKVGPTISLIKVKIETKLEEFTNDENKSSYLNSKLEKHIRNNDIIKALALIDCVNIITESPIENFDLSTIPELARDLGCPDFAIGFTGCCKDLGWVI